VSRRSWSLILQVAGREGVVMDVKKELQKRFNLTDEHFDTHESDLYVKANLDIKEWLKANYEHYENISQFVSQIDETLWFEIPFANTEFWEKKPS